MTLYQLYKKLSQVKSKEEFLKILRENRVSDEERKEMEGDK